LTNIVSIYQNITRSSGSKYAKNVFVAGVLGELQHSPDLLAGFKGPLCGNG